jgi:hypothetical protein
MTTSRIREAWVSEMIRVSPPMVDPTMIISDKPPGIAEKYAVGAS